MPTFPIYAGFSRFEAIEKTNPDIPIGIAKIPSNADFLYKKKKKKIFPNFNPILKSCATYAR
jgi:hypothetical protein